MVKKTADVPNVQLVSRIAALSHVHVYWTKSRSQWDGNKKTVRFFKVMLSVSLYHCWSWPSPYVPIACSWAARVSKAMFVIIVCRTIRQPISTP
jgi:hypothetical protein